MFKLLFALTFLLLLSGCISPRSFVDPNYPNVRYEELKRRDNPPKVVLNVQFQRKGEPLPRADTMLKDNTERVLRASGVLLPVANASGADGDVRVIINNIGDENAAAKGFGTGLTFGLVGTTVTDAYEMTITITVGGRTFSRTSVKHAIHTAIGNTTIPAGLEIVPINVAFERVLEQMLLRVLKEYQETPESASVSHQTAA